VLFLLIGSALICPIELHKLGFRVLLIGEVSCPHELFEGEAVGQKELDQKAWSYNTLLVLLDRTCEFAGNRRCRKELPSLIE